MINIDPILSLNIVDVLSKYITLNRKGNTYKTCCPFHNEKTPSFSVSPTRNIFKCFGCGEGGNAIGFVMKYKNMDFITACKEIAENNNVHLTGMSDEDVAIFQTKKRLTDSVKWLADYYVQNLTIDSAPYKYAVDRWGEESVTTFSIGFAPQGFELISLAKSEGHFENLIQLGYLLKSDKGDNLYRPFFFNRLTFPIWDKTGLVVGITARDITDDFPKSKYINASESSIFNKSKILYGLNFAYKSIVEKQTVYLVEGNPDVIKLHSLNKTNCVCTMGTALSNENIQNIKNITNHVTLIGDYDPPSAKKDNAGEKSMLNNAIALIKNGLMVNLVFLHPENISKKTDPDSFFHTEIDFDAYITENTIDYFIWRANKSLTKASNNINFQTNLVQELSELLLSYNPSLRESYIDTLGKIIKPRKVWAEKLKELKPDKSDNEYFISRKIPKEIRVADIEKYAFYEDKNQYFFQVGSSYSAKTNFVMRPIMHIPSNVNAKRIFELVNTSNFRTIIELAQKDLNSTQAFKLRLESIGNFLFEGTDIDLNKLKRFLYENTERCEEITQLGWQKQGFWAWANGIYFNEEFHQIDEYGICEYKGKKYYLPSYSKIFEDDKELFNSERKFIYKPGKISYDEYFKKFHVVYRDNAIIGLSFFLATLFRDLYFDKFKSFPILNFFGPKGCGKSDMAVGMLQFFGSHDKGPNIEMSTKPALADHLSQSANMLCHIDEYSNSMEPAKMEFLKSVYDGTGRTRMNMERDKKKETTKVDVGLMLCGQEMPTQHIALFSRLIYMTFNRDKFSQAEKDLFDELQLIQHKGLGHIVHIILNFRKIFEKEFENYYLEAYQMLKNNKQANVQERIVKSFSIILSAYNFFSERLNLPVPAEKALEIIMQAMITQNKETTAGDEFSTFWGIFENNCIDNSLLEGVDYKISKERSLKTSIIDTEFKKPITVLYLRLTRVITQYRKTGLLTREPIMPSKTIEYYIKNNNAFLGVKPSVYFLDQKNMNNTDLENKQTRMITSAYCFDYNLLNINIIKYESTQFNLDTKHTFELDDDDANHLNGADVIQEVIQEDDIYKDKHVKQEPDF